MSRLDTVMLFTSDAVEYDFNTQAPPPPLALRVPAESERPVPTVISSIAPVEAVVRPRIREVAIVKPLEVAAHAFTRFTHSTATTHADTRESVVSVACQSSIVLICGAVALTSPPVPVEVAPQRVSTIAQTVVSSRTVAAAAVIVMLASGIVMVFSVVVGQLILVNPFPVPP